MMAVLQAWWQARPERDRQMLQVGGLVLGVLLVVTLGVLPLLDHHRALQARLPLLRGTVLQLEAQADEAQGLRAQLGGTAAGSTTAAPVSAASIEASARAAGLRAGMDVFRVPGEGRVEFSMAKGSFDQVLAWLGQLRRESGVRVLSLQADAGDQPGTVKLKAQLALP